MILRWLLFCLGISLGFSSPLPRYENSYYYYDYTDELLTDDEVEQIQSSLTTTTAPPTTTTTDYPWFEHFNWDWSVSDDSEWPLTDAAEEGHGWNNETDLRDNSTVNNDRAWHDYTGVGAGEHEDEEEEEEEAWEGSGSDDLFIETSGEGRVHPSFKIKVFRM